MLHYKRPTVNSCEYKQIVTYESLVFNLKFCNSWLYAACKMDENCKNTTFALQSLKSAKTSKEFSDISNQWAETYDREEKSLGYCLPEFTVDFIEELITNNSEHFSRSSKIVDFAAGTGFVGEIFRERGFTGQIDALDGAQRMLDIAQKKGVYDRTFCHLLEPDTDLPQEISSGSYDIATVCGGFFDASVIHHECLTQVVNSVRKKGLIVFVIRNPLYESELIFQENLRRVSFRLERKGICRIVDVKYLKSYRKSIAEVEGDTKLGAFFYCYERL